MATTVSYNGSNFSIPANREPRGWGSSLTNFLLEVAQASFTPAGGNYGLQADLNLGADNSAYGLIALYYKSVTANIAQSGQLRLARADTIAWRNQANGADLALGVDSGNRLEFNSVDLVTVSSTDTLTNKTIDGASNTLTNVSLASSVTGTLPVANGGTGVTSSTGSGSVVLSTSPTLTTPNLGTPSAATLTNATGLPIDAGTTGTLPVARGGTGVTSSTGSGSVVLSAAPTITGGATVRGDLLLQNTSGSQPTLQLSEDPDNGTNKVIIQAPANLSADYTLTLPIDDGDANQVLQTDGSGGLSWTSPLTNPMTTLGDVIVGGASGAATRVPTSLLGDITAEAASATVTITIATPGVVTLNSHGLATGDKVYLTTTGALPTGLSVNTAYWVIAVDTNTFRLATTAANAAASTAINTTGSQSGTHTLWYRGLVVRRVSSSEFGLIPPQTAQTTLTFSASNPTASITRAIGIAYRDQDGNWRLRFNINYTVSAGSRASASVTLNGVTFKNVTGHFQPVTGVCSLGAVAIIAYTVPNTGEIIIEHASGSTTVYRLSGDVELESRPTWA